jgi:hypothetical protein
MTKAQNRKMVEIQRYLAALRRVCGDTYIH